MFIGTDEIGFVEDVIRMVEAGTVVARIDRRSAHLVGFVAFIAEIDT